MATPSVVQVADDASNGTTATATFSSAPTEGNTIVVFAYNTSNSLALNTISGYTSIATQSLSQGEWELQFKEAGASESASVSVTRNGASSISTVGIIAFELANADDASLSALVDQTANDDNSTTAVSSQSTGTTGATDEIAELALAFAVWYDDDFSTPSWTNSFSNEIDGNHTSTDTAYGVSWAAASKGLPSTGTVETTNDWSSGGQPEEAFAVVVTLRGVPTTASGSLQAGSATISGEAVRTALASGALSAQAAGVSGSATNAVVASGAVAAGAATISGAAIRGAKASGTPQAQAAAVVGRMVAGLTRPNIGLTATMSDAAVAVEAVMAADKGVSATMSDAAVAVETEIAP